MQTGQETQTKPFWFDMVNRVFGSKDVINPPFLFNSSKGGYETIRKATGREEEKGHVHQLGDGDEMFALATSKGGGKARPIATASQAIWSKHPVKGYVRRRGLKKLRNQTRAKGFINVLDKQVKLLQEAQERDDKMMEKLIQLEEKRAEER